jgi:uncharacterized protein YoxC
MEMSLALQIALFLASLAIVALAVCVVPIAIQVGRSLQHLALATERLEASAQMLAEESRELVRSVSCISDRTNRYMEEMGKAIRVVEIWTERADQFVRQVGEAVEPPILSLVRGTNGLRAGASAFLRTLFHRQQQERPKDAYNSTGEERNHV